MNDNIMIVLAINREGISYPFFQMAPNYSKLIV